MHKIAVMGEKDSILGFKAIGFDTFPTNNEESADLLHRLVNEGYALIYITEHTANGIMDDINRYRDSYFPAIILMVLRQLLG